MAEGVLTDAFWEFRQFHSETAALSGMLWIRSKGGVEKRLLPVKPIVFHFF